MIMSERDSVHKEIEKLQEEVSNSNSRLKTAENKMKGQEEERRKLVCQIELLRREIDAAMTDRDVALKEGHELREKLGERDKSAAAKSTLDFDSRREYMSRLEVDKKSMRDSADSETVDTHTDRQERLGKIESLEQALLE